MQGKYFSGTVLTERMNGKKPSKYINNIIVSLREEKQGEVPYFESLVRILQHSIIHSGQLDSIESIIICHSAEVAATVVCFRIGKVVNALTGRPSKTNKSTSLLRL
jgi:hypothetical protein